MSRQENECIVKTTGLHDAFKLIESSVTIGGVFISNYKRTGEVKAGTVGA